MKQQKGSWVITSPFIFQQRKQNGFRAKSKELLQIEEDEVNRRKLLYQSFVNKNDLCFDVGANMGNRISPLLQIGAKVVAVEPQQQCCRFLQLKFGKKITIVPRGWVKKNP